MSDSFFSKWERVIKATPLKKGRAEVSTRTASEGARELAEFLLNNTPRDEDSREWMRVAAPLIDQYLQEFREAVRQASSCRNKPTLNDCKCLGCRLAALLEKWTPRP
jgi:hypothetical protein